MILIYAFITLKKSSIIKNQNKWSKRHITMENDVNKHSALCRSKEKEKEKEKEKKIFENNH